jgi:hypothetical protein
MVDRDEGDLTAALLHQQRALAALERALGPEHRWTTESRRAFEEIVSDLERRL